MVPQMTSLTFGPYLRQLRQRSGMTQADLAAAVDYSASFISNLEKEARLPDPEIVAHRFIPALALQGEPKLAARLIELAALARGMHSPSSLSISRDTRLATLEGSGVGQDNLPIPPTPLIGRGSDVDWICKRMLGHHGRLMTLVGPPGVGKTRLALESAILLQAVYTDGAFFVPLDAVEDPELVPITIAAALGLEDVGTQKPQQQIIARLRRKEMLWVLDNFEHILPAAPLVSELLAACPRLRILVTSRERLHLRAEQRYRVAPLAVADAGDLFIQAATAIDPDFVLADEDLPLLHELCLELDCLPLALELAAAHIEHLDLPALLDRLRSHRLDLLAEGSCDLPERQRALRTAIAYSYDRLTSGEQGLFRTLGVFAGGFDMDAALIAAPSQAGMGTLVIKHLVQRVNEDDGPYFQLLDTLRTYALEQLTISGELAFARARHARYYLEVTETSERSLYGPDQSRWFRRLARDIHNLRAAIQYFLDEPDLESAARICVALRHFWTMQCRLEEGAMWLDRILSARSDEISPQLQVKIYNSRGSIAFYQEDTSLARASFLRALTLAREVPDHWNLAFALDGLGAVAASCGDYADAIAYSTRSLHISQTHGYVWLSAIALINLGEITRQQGSDAAASTYYDQSLTLLRSIGDNSFSAVALINLAQIALNLRNWSGAKTMAREGLQLSAAGSQYHIMAAALEKLAAIAAHEGDASHSGQLFGAATTLRRRHNIPVQPADRSDYKRMLAAARRARTSALFDEALAIGQTLSLSEALALAAAI